MRRLSWCIGIALLACAAYGGYRIFQNKKKWFCSGNTVEVDGGVIHNCKNSTAPKAIRSTEITEFHCVFSLYAVVDPGSLGSRVYSLDAVLDNSIVKGSMNWYDRTDSDHFVFDATPVFLEKLQQAVAKHNLAQHNGYVYTVSGLPDMYGAKLDIVYQSGEAIYANDNQDCFLSMEAMEDLVKVFREYARR